MRSGSKLVLLYSLLIACNDIDNPNDEFHSGLIEKDYKNDQNGYRDYMDLTYNSNNKIISFSRSEGSGGFFETKITYDSEDKINTFNTISGYGDIKYNIFYENEDISKIIYKGYYVVLVTTEDIVSHLYYDSEGRVSFMIDTVMLGGYELDTAIYNWEFSYHSNGKLEKKVKYDVSGKSLLELSFL